MIIWALTTREAVRSKKVVICQGENREEAKRVAHPELGGNPDEYVVSPISQPEDIIILKLKIEGKIG